MQVFLEYLQQSGLVGEACARAGISRQTAYNWRDRSVAFRTAWGAAHEDAVDALHKEARRRALDHSDYLLWKLLVSGRPDEFAERTIVAGDKDRPIRVDHNLIVADLRRMIEAKAHGEPISPG